MGIYDRDYYQQRGSGAVMPPVCKYLIIVTVAVFLLQIFVTRPTTPEDLLALRERQREWLQEPRHRTDLLPSARRRNSRRKTPSSDWVAKSCRRPEIVI